MLASTDPETALKTKTARPYHLAVPIYKFQFPITFYYFSLPGKSSR